jgi:glycosyltransferase involved in cell wall biosynthesis
MLLVESMKEVVSERNDVFCYIGGSGPLRRELEARVSELGLHKHVRILGFVPEDELVYWFNSADLFVLPSLSEGNPGVMFEALGCGTPVVATRIGGIPEVINSEEYGVLTDAGDSHKLAKTLLNALDKNWNHEKILSYASRFSWENNASAMKGVYDEITSAEIRSG